VFGLREQPEWPDGDGVGHTQVMPVATGVLGGLHDSDGHELSFCARTTAEVRDDARRPFRAAGTAVPS
jgi:hypothetical protein